MKKYRCQPFLLLILISLLMTGCGGAYVKARQNALKNSCINNLRQLQAAVQMYAIEYDKVESDPITGADWIQIQQYLHEAPLSCPVDAQRYEKPETYGSVPTCPDADLFPDHELP